GSFRIIRRELAFGTGEVKGCERLVHEHRPTRSPDQPLDGDAPAVSAEAISSLAAAHRIEIPAAVELRSTFAHSQNRTVAEQKSYRAALFVDSQFLQRLACAVQNSNRKWIMVNRDVRASDTLAGCRRSQLGFKNCAIIGLRSGRSANFSDTDANGMSADCGDGNPGFPAGDLNLLLSKEQGGQVEAACGNCTAQQLQRIPARQAF